MPDTFLSQQFHLNADFNFNLHTPLTSPKLQEVSREWTHQGVLYGLGANICLLEGRADPEYIKYIQKILNQNLNLREFPHLEKKTPYSPHGWDSNSLKILKAHQPEKLSEIPKIEAIQKANDRFLASQLERESGQIEPLSYTVQSLEEVNKVADIISGPMLFKARFSSSGLGNKLVLEKTKLPWDFIKKQINNFGGFVIEPLLERIMDFASLYFLDKNGKVLKTDEHILYASKKGGFTGMEFHPQLNLPIKEMQKSVSAIGSKLYNIGYWGPFGIDSFYYSNKGKKYFRPLVEINSRRTLGHLFHYIYKSLSLTEWAHWKLYPIRKLKPNISYPMILSKLGSNNFNPQSKKGILLSCPLNRYMGSNKVSMQKIALLFCGPNKEYILELEKYFESQFAN